VPGEEQALNRLAEQLLFAHPRIHGHAGKFADLLIVERDGDSGHTLTSFGTACDAAARFRATTIRATAARMMPPAISVRALTASPRNAAPRITATTGLTYAYVDTRDSGADRNNQT